MGEYNNEKIGIAVEVAIADAFGIEISENYRNRADTNVCDILTPSIIDIFNCKNIPCPIAHIAEGQNSVDFELENGLTLSVKTNQKTLGNVAPQVIGQPTSSTYFDYFSNIIDVLVPMSYDDKRQLFKKISLNNTAKVMQEYWMHLFECDYLLYFYRLIDKNGYISNDYKYICIPKPKNIPIWRQDYFKFTKSLETWNESCTVKYKSNTNKWISIGEFQTHNNRDCLKFRFKLNGILKLIETGSI